jgi:hypothetical protein
MSDLIKENSKHQEKNMVKMQLNSDHLMGNWVLIKTIKGELRLVPPNQASLKTRKELQNSDY